MNLENTDCKVYRPWGWYMNIEGDDHSGFKVKKIGVNPAKKNSSGEIVPTRLSLQSHEKRSEHWVIIKGKGIARVGDDYHELAVNQHIMIQIGELHRMENAEEEILEFIEVQIGKYLGEDDIIRYEDDFGRV